jgi:hypothetical protein
MENVKNLTIIIPVHVFDDTVNSLLEEAVDSVTEQVPIIIAAPKKVLTKIQETDKVGKHEGIEFLQTKKEDFCSQVNAAVAACKTEYFTVLEYDDKFTPNFLKNVKLYTETYKDVFGFLSLVEAVDYEHKDAGPIGYINEVFWASSFSEVLGYLDFDSVSNFLSINVTGAVFKTQEFIEIGGLKPSIKIAFWHEFLLRAIHKEKKLFVIPKVGYIHTINRPDSLSDINQKTVSAEEAEWWVELAQQEYYYVKDRNKTYEKQ